MYDRLKRRRESQPEEAKKEMSLEKLKVCSNITFPEKEMNCICGFVGISDSRLSTRGATLLLQD